MLLCQLIIWGRSFYPCISWFTSCHYISIPSLMFLEDVTWPKGIIEVQRVRHGLSLGTESRSTSSMSYVSERNRLNGKWRKVGDRLDGRDDRWDPKWWCEKITMPVGTRRSGNPRGMAFDKRIMGIISATLWSSFISFSWLIMWGPLRGTRRVGNEKPHDGRMIHFMMCRVTRSVESESSS